MCRSSLRVAGRPAYHAYASSYDTSYACYGDWARTASTSVEQRPVASPLWMRKPVYPGATSETLLPAPPKPRRSRSPGERSTSSSSLSRDFEGEVPVQSWDPVVHSDLMIATRSPPRRLSPSAGYPHVFHPGTTGAKGPADFAAKTLSRQIQRRMAADDADTAYLRTRASYRRSEEENAPIAKRLRR